MWLHSKTNQILTDQNVTSTHWLSASSIPTTKTLSTGSLVTLSSTGHMCTVTVPEAIGGLMRWAIKLLTDTRNRSRFSWLHTKPLTVAQPLTGHCGWIPYKTSPRTSIQHKLQLIATHITPRHLKLHTRQNKAKWRNTGKAEIRHVAKQDSVRQYDRKFCIHSKVPCMGFTSYGTSSQWGWRH